MVYFILFVLALVVSWLLTIMVKRLARHSDLLDYPNERKQHPYPIPLGGGVAIWLAFNIVLWLVVIFYPQYLLGKDLSLLKLGAISIASAIIILGGLLDDRYHLSPGKQFIWPVAAALLIVVAGIGVPYVSHPLGQGLLFLDSIKFHLYQIDGQIVSITLWGSLFTFLWLLGMMYTTKLLDGLDGLASGIGMISSLIIFGLTQMEQWYQPSIGVLAVMLAGCLLGFLIFNWYPAKIFLGEGGSLYIGFILGVLAIVSGGKIATALLVMGIPILDVIWVIIRRWWFDKTSLVAADRRHLHHRLLDVGFSHRQAVLFLYFLTASFGVASLFLHTQGKVLTLSILVVVMILLAAALVVAYKIKRRWTTI